MAVGCEIKFGKEFTCALHIEVKLIPKLLRLKKLSLIPTLDLQGWSLSTCIVGYTGINKLILISLILGL
jgi:hypothetical protein